MKEAALFFVDYLVEDPARPDMADQRPVATRPRTAAW